MSIPLALFISVILLAGNAFFVAAEFALVASKGYRLEQAVARGRRGARAALDGTRELSLMLAGAQLGITLCTLGLGALAEPALAHAIDPALKAVGLPAPTSYAIAFLLALATVVFLHMVVGEMAPKSWAISDPEHSAILLAPPFRLFARAFRPVLRALNAAANGFVRLFRVPPQEQLAVAHGPEELAILLEQSRQHGKLEPAHHELLTRILRLHQKTLLEVMAPIDEFVSVRPGDAAHEIERVCRSSGHSRLAVVDGGAPLGIVHVRAAVRSTTLGPPAVTAAELMTAPLRLRTGTNLIDAVARMRAARAQLAIVEGAGGRVVGFVALEDILEEVIGDFTDETDPAPPSGTRPS